MNSGHKSFFNSEVIIDNFSEGGKTVGGAGSVGNDVLIGFVTVVVYSVDVGGGGIFGGGRKNNFFGT